MIRILTVCPMAADGTSFYRVHGVLPDLVEKIPDLHVDKYTPKPGGWSWADFVYYDVVLLQRPGRIEDVEIARNARLAGAKLWIDYDDNFFCLPDSNRMYEAVNPDVVARMKGLIQMADVITVSTPELKKQMDALKCRYCEVVPNALSVKHANPVTRYNFKKPSIPPLNHKQVYVWRGSDTHVEDCLTYMMPMTEAMTARPDVNWTYMGWNPWFITRDMNCQIIEPAPDILSYFQKLKMIRPELMHVVLAPNQFNLNKSNCAWIEATAAGAVCLAPEWGEWQRPGIITYSTPEGYKQELIKPSVDYAAAWKLSYEYIMDELTVSVVNKQRSDILQKLINGYDFSKEIKLPIPATMIE